MSKAGERLLRSARQAREIAAGQKEPPRIHVPAEIDVRAVRKKLGVTQDDFATEFGFSISQIRDWEQARHRPLGAERAYLMLIDRNPDVVRQLLDEARRDIDDQGGSPEGRMVG